jgi:hypothetical protein
MILPQGFVDARQVQAVEAAHGNHTVATGD